MYDPLLLYPSPLGLFGLTSMAAVTFPLALTETVVSLSIVESFVVQKLSDLLVQVVQHTLVSSVGPPGLMLICTVSKAKSALNSLRPLFLCSEACAIHAESWFASGASDWEASFYVVDEYEEHINGGLEE